MATKISGIRKADQFEKTRAALLKAAQELFMTRGYADTSTEEIVKRARVTRGALYYHFRDKAALFEAVFYKTNEALRRNTVARMAAAEGDMWQRMVLTGSQIFLDACIDPGIQRILFLDAPAVLGWERWNDWDDGSARRMVRQTLQALMDQGLIEPQPLDPLAHLMTEILTGAALYIARANKVDLARQEMGESLERFLNGLRVKPSARIADEAER